MDFDPEIISYADLLVKFFEWHNPFKTPYARQYMSAVLLHDQEQRDAWDKAVKAHETGQRKVRSEVQGYSSFTWAEDYHQKYYLRRNKVVALALKEQCPTYEEFVDSTLTAKANAVLGGYLKPTTEKLREWGFSEELATELLGPRKSLFGRLFSGT